MEKEATSQTSSKIPEQETGITNDPTATVPAVEVDSTASLFVANLPGTITEDKLNEIFSQVGQVAQLKLFREVETGRPLGHAIVDYHNSESAKNALQNLNFTIIDEKEIRIMWTQRNPSLRRSGVGNIFVKNLDKDVNNRIFRDIFSFFGNVLSSKVAVDFEGNSRGYGFVHYDNIESARKAIEKVNGVEYRGKKLKVEEYIPKEKRKGNSVSFTNVYIKNFSPTDFPNEEAFKDFFGKFGEVSSVYFPLDKNGNPKGFGCVDYKNPEDALSVTTKELKKDGEGEDGKTSLYACKFLNRADRNKQLREEYLRWKERMDTATSGRNLFVSNIPLSTDSKALAEKFSEFGEIQTTKVAKNSKNEPLGFGFVCFTKQENAEAAIDNLNESDWAGKRIKVALWERKEIRMQKRAIREQMRQQMQNYNQTPMPVGYMQNPTVQMYPNTADGSGMYPMQPFVPVSQNQNFAQNEAPGALQPELEIDLENKDEVENYVYNRAHRLYPEHAQQITGMFISLNEENKIKVLMSDDVVDKFVFFSYDKLVNANQ